MSESENSQNNTTAEQTENQDPAGRLLLLIERMNGTLNKQDQHSNNRLGKVALHQSFEQISVLMGMSNYGELLAKFIRLCEGTKREIMQLDLKRESVRESWIRQIDQISGVFNATNFPLITSQVFNSHFSEINKASLDAISERFLTDRIVHSSCSDLKESLEIIRDTVSIFEDTEKVSPKFSKLFKYYISSLENIIQHYDDLGEDNFWENYKIIFATFMQIHDNIVDDSNRETINQGLRKTLNRLVMSSSLGANAITIGAFAVPLLGG